MFSPSLYFFLVSMHSKLGEEKKTSERKTAKMSDKIEQKKNIYNADIYQPK